MGSFVTKPSHDAKAIDQVDPKENDDLDYSEDSLAEMECDISLDLDDTPNQCEISELDLSQFPFSHPRVFSQMLMSLDSQSLLGLRLVCSTWLLWMNRCRVWSKALTLRRAEARLAAGDQVIRNMRLDRMELLPAGTEEECRQLCIRMDRVAGEEIPPVEEGRINLVQQLHLAVDMDEMDGPVLGPVEVFVRVKVDHPVVKQIVKENIVRFLNSILVDENDRRALMMWRKYPVLCTDGAMLPINFQEPIYEVEQSKLEQILKKIKLDEDLENLSKVEAPTRINPDFPTLLEILDIDDPIIKTMLIQKTGIDKILACPRFNEIMSRSSSNFDSLLKVQGVGMDGKVCEVNLSMLKEGDVAVMGYHVNQCFTPRDQAKNLLFWGGPDIRHNWPVFAQQLKEIDSNIEGKPLPPKNADYKPSDPVETSACMARLAARGLLISTGTSKPVVPEPDPAKADDEPFYPFTSLANSDPFSANPVSEELYISLAARGLSLSLAQRSTGTSRNVDGNGASGSDQSDGDQPGDVIIYDRAGASNNTSGLRAMLEARGVLRIDGGRATLRMEGFEENDEDSDDSDWDVDDEETDEEDDEDAEEWYRNYISQRASEAQGGDSNEIVDNSMGEDLIEDVLMLQELPEDEIGTELRRIVFDSMFQDLTGDEINAVAQREDDRSNRIPDDLMEKNFTENVINTGAAAPTFKIVMKALELPIVNDAFTAATKLHTEAITYPYVNQVETIIGGLITKADDTLTPCVSETITSTVRSTIAQLDTFACSGLDQFTAKVPSIKLPTGELATATTDATVNLATTLVNFLATFTVVWFILTCAVFILGCVVKGLEAALGLYEATLPGFLAPVLDLVKIVLRHVKTAKVMLGEVVKTNAIVEEEKPKEEGDSNGVLEGSVNGTRCYRG